jgi:nucleoside-diphosphate-sugar epimerase
MYGPRDTEIFIYFQTIARGLDSMIGFDDKRLSLLHSDDLVHGMQLAAEADVSVGETYYISSEEFYSWPQVGRITAEVMKKRTFTVRIPHTAVYSLAAIAQSVAALQRKAATLNIEKARDITQRYWTCDVSKAKRDLGYRQQLSLEEGIRNTVEWYRAQGWLK